MPAKTKVRARDLEPGDVLLFKLGGSEAERGVVESKNDAGVGLRVAELGSLVWLRPEHPLELA